MILFQILQIPFIVLSKKDMYKGNRLVAIKKIKLIDFENCQIAK
jgi:hypothetical protein